MIAQNRTGAALSGLCGAWRGVMHLRTMITAHSGCEGRPDNSLEYVRYALGCGADALEVDVHSRGSGFYISHDPSEGDHPRLEEVFSLIRGGTRKLNCDLKQPGMEQDVLALARSCGMADQLIFSGAVSHQALGDPAVGARTFWNIESAMPQLFQRYEQGIMPTAEEIRQAAGLCREHGAGVINVYYAVCTAENLKIFREYGVGVSAWTVNEEAEARRLLAEGIVNITTRRPVMVCALRKDT